MVWACWGCSGLPRLGLVDPFPNDLSLERFLGAFEALPLPYHIAGQVMNVLLVTVLLLAVYYVGRHLFEPRIALVSALLLSLDPTLLGYSRLAHMSIPHALLMLLAVMAWLLWLREGGRKWLVLTGVFTGLALSTLVISLILLPVLVLVAGVVWVLQRRKWFGSEAPTPSPTLPLKGEGETPLSLTGRGVGGEGECFNPTLPSLLLNYLLLLLIAALIFVIVWPAMWFNPAGAIQVVLDRLLSSSQAGFGDLGIFWQGALVSELGLSYYPVVWVLKVSPLMLLGLILSFIFWRRSFKQRPYNLLWLYAIVYTLVMSFGSAKSVRYLLPTLTAMGPLAAYGLVYLYDKLVYSNLNSLEPKRNETRRRRDAKENKKNFAPLRLRLKKILQLGLALGLTFTLLYSPYYLNYFNPLVLGWRWAPQTTQVGWGEGLSDAAFYLNELPDIEERTIAAWYDWLFSPYSDGQVLALTGWNTVHSDYVVFYSNQVQRKIPDPNLITYFQRRRPLHTITLNGIDYAWIYPSLSAERPLPESAIPLNIEFDRQILLMGYEVRPTDDGQALIVTLYWQGLRPRLPEYYVYVRAIADDNEIMARSDSPPVMNFLPTTEWVKGELVEDAQVLSRPPETPPGQYRLEVGLYSPTVGTVLPSASGEQGAGGGVILGEISLP